MASSALVVGAPSEAMVRPGFGSGSTLERRTWAPWGPKGLFPQGFPRLCAECDLTVYVVFLILRCLSGVVCALGGGPRKRSSSWKEYLRSRNKERRNGTEERPEWGASPAKPSEPLRIEARRRVLPSGVRTEFLAGGISGFAVDLSALLCALAHFGCAPARAARLLCIPLGCTGDKNFARE